MTLDSDPYGGDELLRAVVEQAISPHADRLDPEALASLRDRLILFVTTHPAAEPWMARLRDRPKVVQSTWIGSEGVDTAPSTSQRRRGTGGRQGGE